AQGRRVAVAPGEVAAADERELAHAGHSHGLSPAACCRDRRNPGDGTERSAAGRSRSSCRAREPIQGEWASSRLTGRDRPTNWGSGMKNDIVAGPALASAAIEVTS